MSPIYNFLSEKKRILAELESAIANGIVDNRVLSILKLINSHPDYYTTSSCSGRVLLISLANPGSKNRSKILARWHEKFKLKDLKNALKKWDAYPFLFYFAQSPIFHICTNKLNAAILLRNLGEQSGFKYSSIRSIKNIKGKRSKHSINYNDQNSLRVTIELLSTERLNTPVGIDGEIIINDKYLKLLVKIGNDMLNDSRDKLKNLEKVLLTNLGQSNIK